MKIVRLGSASVSPVVAEAYKVKNKNNKESFSYNVRHGTAGPKLGFWSVMLDFKLGKPENKESTLLLDQNNYVLRPFAPGGVNGTDVLGNKNYIISTDNNSIFKDDLLVLWDIHHKNYIKVEYEISGDISEIGKAYNGRDRGDIVYKSPAPILEVFGDCTLAWTGTNQNGDVFSQTFEYTYQDQKWNIGQIVKNQGVQNEKDDL